MEAIARTRYLRVSPTKARLVVDQIRGKNVESAMQILEFSDKRVALAIKETLKSAIANAENNFGLDVDTLLVTKACVDQAPTLKRFRPRARGRACRILKRSSHVTIGLTSDDDVSKE